jgi:hypothetical protein
MLPRIHQYPDPLIATYRARVRARWDAEWEALAPLSRLAPAGGRGAPCSPFSPSAPGWGRSRAVTSAHSPRRGSTT